MEEPFKKIAIPAQGAPERQLLTRYLSKLPNGMRIEIELQEHPEKFSHLQNSINLEGSKIVRERVGRIFGKRNEQLSLQDRSMLQQNRVMSLTERDFSPKELAKIADDHDTSVETVKTLIKWRNRDYPWY